MPKVLSFLLFCALGLHAAQSSPNIVAVGQAVISQATQTQVAFQFGNLAAQPRFTMTYGVEFAIGSISCTSSSCVVGVTFSPAYPGLRQDSIVAKDSSGKAVATTQVFGIGQGPQAVILPGVINTAAGISASFGFGGDGGLATKAFLKVPQGVAVDPIGNLFIADSLNNVIRRVDATSGQISTVAGNSYYGYQGDGHSARSAELGSPAGVAVDGAGSIFIADTGNNVIRRVDSITGFISTVAGGGSSGLGDGGQAISAALWGPAAVAVDPKGNLYVADTYNNLIRKIDTTGIITTVAGGGNNPGTDGFGDGGPAIGCNLSTPNGIALDATGNLYIADSGNNLVRKVDMTSGTITAVAGNGSRGYASDGSPATSSPLSSPSGVAIDAANNVYIADTNNNVIRKVDAGTGLIAAVAGSGAAGFLGDGGNSLNAELYSPMSLVLDNTGNLYTADYGNNVVRKITSTAAPLAFPSVGVGSSSGAQTITLSNIGNQPLSVNSLNAGANFTQSSTNCVPQSSLAAGTSCIISVAFSPTVSGTVSGSLNIADNSLSNSASSQQVVLAGVAVPVAQISLSPSSLSFSNQLIATVSNTQAVTLRNPGTAALSITSITVSGSNAGDFSQTNNCPASLAVNASCTLTVAFTPSAAGSRSAVINIINNSASGTTQTVALAGTGVNCSYALNQSTISFGPSASTGALTVTTSNSCSWAASSNSSWLTITAGASGVGAGPVSYSVAANTSSISRTGSATVAGQKFTVVQTGVAPPAVTGVSPASGTGLTQTFTFSFSDPRGSQDFGIANVIINNALDGRRACYIAYSRPANVLYLVDDSGSNLLPGFTLNGSGSAGNSQCTISGAKSSATVTGNTLTLALNITFTASFAGSKITYVAIRDVVENNSGWQAAGVWQVPGTTQTTTTSVVKMTPSAGTGHSATFAFTFTDTKGFHDLGVVNALINSALDGRHACYIAYSTSANVLYLVSDDGTSLSAGLVLNGSGSVSNSQCTITGAGSSATGSGNTLTLSLALTFSSTFSGNRIFFVAARDTTDANNTGWQSIGSWTAQ